LDRAAPHPRLLPVAAARVRTACPETGPYHYTTLLPFVQASIEARPAAPVVGRIRLAVRTATNLTDAFLMGAVAACRTNHPLPASSPVTSFAGGHHMFWLSGSRRTNDGSQSIVEGCNERS